MKIDTGSWQSSVTLQLHNGIGQIATVTSPAGEITLAWNTATEIYAQRHNPTQGIEEPVLVASKVMYLDSLKIVSDKHGNLLLTWSQAPQSATQSSYPEEIYAARFDKNHGWQPPENLLSAAAGQHPNLIDIGSDGEGNALLIWRGWYSGEDASIWSLAFDKDSGWSTAPVLLALGNVGAQFAMSETGDAIAAITQWDLGLHEISLFGAYYHPSSGWSSLIELTLPHPSVYRYDIDFHANGQGVVVWTDSDTKEVLACNFDRNLGWGVPELVQPYTAIPSGSSQLSFPGSYASGSFGFQRDPVTAISPSGEAMAVWVREFDAFLPDGSVNPNPLRFAEILFAVRQPGAGWSTQLLFRDTVTSNDYPHLCIDASGRATVLWIQSDYSKHSLLNYNNPYQPYPSNLWMASGTISGGFDAPLLMTDSELFLVFGHVRPYSGSKRSLSWVQEKTWQGERSFAVKLLE